MSAPDPYLRERIESWVGDFCESEHFVPFGDAVRRRGPEILVAFLTGACAAGDAEPEDLTRDDLKQGLLGIPHTVQVPAAAAGEVAALCGAFLAQLEDDGRLADGRELGAYVAALRDAFLGACGQLDLLRRDAPKVGRNDPCPCGSGQKYKKCCMRLLG